jgi:hypothetical protein
MRTTKYLGVMTVAAVVGLVIGGIAGPAAAKGKLSCKRLLKPAEIERIVGVAATTQTAGGTTGYLQCAWTLPSGRIDLSAGTPDAVNYNGVKLVTPPGAIDEDVDGIGNEAFVRTGADGSLLGLWARTKKSALFLSLADQSGDPAATKAATIALAKQAAKRLK